MSSDTGKKTKKKSERKDEAYEETERKMDTTAPTVYNEWRVADGLFRPEETSKTIWFKGGFVRVRKEDWNTIVQEGWAVGKTGQTFHVPSGHYCEVLGSPEIMFTRD